MTAGKTGSLIIEGTKGMSVRVDWTENYDADANISVLDVSATVITTLHYGLFYLNGTVKAEEETLITMDMGYGTHNVSFWTYSECLVNGVGGYADPPWQSSEISHNNDGSKQVAITVDIQGRNQEGTISWEISGTETITLTHIPKASTIGATDADIGAVSMIAVNRRSSAFTHSIEYRFGDLSGYITSSGVISSTEEKMDTTSVAFTLPIDWYAQIRNEKSGICTLICRTYSGETQIGEAETSSFAVKAVEQICKPVVNGVVEDINEVTAALTGDPRKFVRFCSSALCTLSAEAKHSAVITEKKINGTTVSEDTLCIENLEVSAVEFYAKDSRGYESSEQVAFELIPYIKLTNNCAAKRLDQTSGNVKLVVKGNYYNGSFGTADNMLLVRYRVAQAGANYGEYIDVDVSPTDNSYTTETLLAGLEYDQIYYIEVTVSDALDTITKKLTIQKGTPVADWGEQDWRFNVPVTFAAGPFYESLDYPGCFYQKKDQEISWVNPPMETNVEYRTTECFQGQPVYVKLVDFGNSSHGKEIIYNTEEVTPLRFAGQLVRADDVITALPMYHIDASAGLRITDMCSIIACGNKILMMCGTDCEGCQTTVQVWYVKI